MKILLSLAALLLVALGLNLSATDDANAGGCAAWRRCGPAVMVPAPNPIPLKRIRLNRAPCVVGCGTVAVAPAPVPCATPCGARSYFYQPTRFYAYWAQPGFTSCYPGPGNCYFRRDCWYDSFGRRFCS